ncbi:AvrD family protein [Myceligenerans crystallogenes]|uniref:AvrD family protein n=1 Tax=Myceligenerans crystallogenes TaxID=316335 RepID=A0ABN2NH40_9MICO
MTTLRLSSIDDYLGPAAQRFFGAGYRRSEIDLDDVRTGTDHAAGTLSVRYPQDWSRKKTGVDLRPHLSTIDGLLVAAQLADALLTQKFGFTGADRAGIDLTKVVIQAGTEPDEVLAAVPVSAGLRRTTEDGTGRATSMVDVTVGRMRLRCHTSHRIARPRADAGTRPVPEVLGDPRTRFWGEGYRASRQSIDDVVADLSSLTATARLTTDELPGTLVHGLGGRPDRVTLVDAFVSSLQVFQVMLYELDGLSRAESNTLWMQQTTLTRVPGDRASHDVRVGITSSELLELGDTTWRNLTFESTAGPVRQRSVFAHNLPAGAPVLAGR